MKVIYNKIIPMKGFVAMNLFGVIFVREGHKIGKITLNHESIYTAQMKEMLYIFFYLWYVIEWCVRLFQRGNAYRNISFEKEAYANEKDLEYLNNRKHFAWFRFIKK